MQIKPETIPVAHEALRSTDELIERRGDREILPITLTQSDKLERGEKMAKNLGAIDLLNKELNEHKALVKAKLETLVMENDIASQELRQGFYKDDVTIEEEKNFRDGVIRKKRMDTGDIYHSRDMTPSEKQRGMKF